MAKNMIDTVSLSNISTRNKLELVKDNVGFASTQQLISDGLYTNSPPRILGIENVGILNSRVKDYSKKYYSTEGGRGKPNRLKIDCVAKNGKVFNNVNLQPKDVEIVDINPKIYLTDRYRGINQLMMILDQINKEQFSFVLSFSNDQIEETSEVVYDVLNRLSVYKDNYWHIKLLTLRVKDLDYIVGKGANNRVLQFIEGLPNIAISLSEEIEDKRFSDNLLKIRPKFNVLFLIRDNPQVGFKNATQIANSCKAKVMVCESEIVSILNSEQKYIELVTGQSPTKPVLGLPYPLYYSINPIESILKKGMVVELKYQQGRLLKLKSPTNKPTIILHNEDKSIGTKILDGLSYRTLLLNNPLDLPYIMVLKLKELVVK